MPDKSSKNCYIYKYTTMAAAAVYIMFNRHEISQREEEIKRVCTQIRKDGHYCGCVKYYGRYPQLFWCNQTPCTGPPKLRNI